MSSRKKEMKERNEIKKKFRKNFNVKKPAGIFISIFAESFWGII